MNYIIYTDATSTTGKSILAELKEKEVKIEGGTKEPKGKVETLIRWGAVKTWGQKPIKVINNAKAIGLASNKLEALRTLADNDIRVPEIVQPKEVTDKSFPLFGRKLHHMAGSDIVFCLQKQDVNVALKSGCTYFTKYIPKKLEYRIHVFGGEVIKSSQKLLTDKKLNKDPWIWNFDEGYTYHALKEKPLPMVRGQAVAAVECLGLNFGAVDVMVDDNNKVYILEVNTAPGLQTDSSLAAYVEKFKAAINVND